MKLVVINQPLRNHGDEAAHRAFIRALLDALPQCSIRLPMIKCRPEDIEPFRVDDRRVEYVWIDTASDRIFNKVTKRAMQLGLPFRKTLCRLSPSCRAIMKEFENGDVVICAPGGTCLGVQQNWGHLAMMRMAAESGRPLAYWGRSIGPFPQETLSQKMFYRNAVRCLRSCGFVSLRDRRSMEMAAALGIRATEVTDSAFLEAVPEVPRDAYAVFVPNVLSSMAGFRELPRERSAAFFGKVLDEILREFDGKIVMLPQLFGQGEWDDAPFFEEIASGRERVSVLPDSCPSDTQQKIVGGARFLVGARYHSMIFALNTGTPFIAFSYEHKISGLLEILGLQQRMTDLQNGAFDSASSEEAVLEDFRGKLKKIYSLPMISRENAARPAVEGLRKLISFINEKV